MYVYDNVLPQQIADRLCNTMVSATCAQHGRRTLPSCRPWQCLKCLPYLVLQQRIAGCFKLREAFSHKDMMIVVAS